MSLRLKNRQRQIPGGFNYFDPATRYTAPRFASFNVIVDGLTAARRSNPDVTKRAGLSDDPLAIANEVDAYNAMLCYQHRYMDYIEGQPEGVGAQAAQAPFQRIVQNNPHFHGVVPRPATRPAPFTRVVAGASVISRWLKSGADAVPASQSESRARTCAGCPLNEKGDWTTWFSLPAANAIRSFLTLRKEWNLATSFDDQLNMCGACGCVLTLKVHMPLKDFIDDMKPEDKDALWDQCWIRSEERHRALHPGEKER